MLERLAAEGVRSLSVVGLSKNAGKTTVLNTLAKEGEEKGLLPGFVSVGVDGEERDVWSLREKPPVWIPAGGLVATAASLLDVRGGDWELLESTPLPSPLGPVTLARARRRTKVKLAGVTRTDGVRKMVSRLSGLGAGMVWVDGAYDRKAAANPWVTDATVCVVGAAMGRSLDQILQRTEETIRILTLPEVKDPLARSAAEMAKAGNRLVGVREGDTEVLPATSLLLEESVREALVGKKWAGLALPGSLTDRGLEFLLSLGSPLSLTVTDPTRCFVSLSTLRKFYRQGGHLSYLKGIRLAAVAINPVSPDGYAFDPAGMRAQVARICEPIPVFDAVRDSRMEIFKE
ncbi:hypothetical protein [Kroppenstedtia eburnea]|uniref:Uncharacterized protein n=1 Tax=Kroppenstedtia eburnea TaxID=714067 RepID=A0A1N7JJH2_9BACL|nr:hypothetical protein [Kroppenstedtia eburnea]QKI83558.1 hypothetical protein GXN75_17095 [Kroppenstedtia eburnea]SIS49469.1 hypothetical protein SAMN05421790_102164 [Kroppenstedtia eburnea]